MVSNDSALCITAQAPVCRCTSGVVGVGTEQHWVMDSGKKHCIAVSALRAALLCLPLDQLTERSL
eukprot:1157065-Pelagomonas_calceolata.AAC.26